MNYYIIVFKNTYDAMAAEKKIKELNFNFKIMPTPTSIAMSCGICVRIDKKEDIITKTKGIDFALLALHGQFGEDGTVQSVLQTLGIPYSGCGPLSSAMCMDKDVSKSILEAAAIRTAP